ncbi:hypothetical protein K501DRAFT_265137 [Backusella circina FSU 941]|nr:hypothetical protein K501DRAFT_265137 [Backusella circina FSU 941]
MKTIHCILFTIISTLQILPVFGASPFANQACDVTQNGNCQAFSQAGGVKCICNSYKPGSSVTFCSANGPDGHFQLCSEGSEVQQKCATLCGNSGVFICENGYCHSN